MILAHEGCNLLDDLISADLFIVSNVHLNCELQSYLVYIGTCAEEVEVNWFFPQMNSKTGYLFPSLAGPMEVRSEDLSSNVLQTTACDFTNG